MRWASPPDRVDMVLARDRYSRPTLHKKLSLCLSSLSRASAIMSLLPEKVLLFSHSSSFWTLSLQNSAIERSSTLTDKALGDSLSPWQAGQSAACL